jgi:dTDP-4-amino-4,6-dideoxygalactose transaminase
MIKYNVPAITHKEADYIGQVIAGQKLCGDGAFTKRCEALLQERLGAPRVLLTTSCTHALEMAALLLDIQPGDEVIMPSFTFVSSANAFVLRGARIVFVDVRPETMNMDMAQVRSAMTNRTRAIVPVHYAGVGCDMDDLIEIAARDNVAIIEDAAQGIGARYRGRPLGTIGNLGCISFHETKNIHCGEGGALVINDPRYLARAEIIREKGTNRSSFLRGEIDKYTWVDIGSSYVTSELNAAFLLAQLESLTEINQRRSAIWHEYHAVLSNAPGLQIPQPPDDCDHNSHIFWIKAESEAIRDSLIDGLRTKGIQAPFHYVPLHETTTGKRFGRFHGEDRFTTAHSSRLLRLPLHGSLKPEEIAEVTDSLRELIKTHSAKPITY